MDIAVITVGQYKGTFEQRAGRQHALIVRRHVHQHIALVVIKRLPGQAAVQVRAIKIGDRGAHAFGDDFCDLV